MRIGFDGKRAFSNNTGLGNYSRDTIRIISKSLPQNQFFIYTPKEKKNDRLSFLNESKNIFIRTPNKILSRLFSSIWRSKTIVKDLFQNKIDLYHGLSHEIPLGIEKTNIKSIVTIHDLIYLRFPKLFSKIDRKIYDIKFRSSCQRANKIIAVSQQTKSDIIKYFGISKEKIEVIYQGCNPIFQEEKSVKKINKVVDKYKLPKEFLLYVGSIEERKNLLTLLRAIANIPDQILVVIGSGIAYKEKCLTFIDDNKLNNRVIFLKNLSLEEMACIYQKAEIFIYPSIFEGFGIPILEALFSKTPVITSKGSCFSEAGGENSKYIDPLSELEITQAILDIKSNKKLQNLMIEKGYQYALNFKDEKISKNLISIYNSLI